MGAILTLSLLVVFAVVMGLSFDAAKRFGVNTGRNGATGQKPAANIKGLSTQHKP